MVKIVGTDPAHRVSRRTNGLNKKAAVPYCCKSHICVNLHQPLFSVLLICIESFCYVLFLFSFQRIHDLLSSELDLRKCHCYAFGKIVSVNIFKVYTLLSILYQIYILEYNWNIFSQIQCNLALWLHALR